MPGVTCHGGRLGGRRYFLRERLQVQFRVWELGRACEASKQRWQVGGWVYEPGAQRQRKS